MWFSKRHMSEKTVVLKCSIFWLSISLKKIKWYLSYFSWSWSSSKCSIWKNSSLIGCFQVCLSCNQIVWFFDYHHLGRESSYIIVFMHAVSHQGKVAFETTTFGCVWSVKLLVKLDCRILWSTISLKRIIWHLTLLLVIKGMSHRRLSLLVDSASGQIGFQDSLVISISEKESIYTFF